MGKKQTATSLFTKKEDKKTRPPGIEPGPSE